MVCSPRGSAGRIWEMTTPALCPTCGRPLDEHNRQVRFKRPDAVFAIPGDDLAGRVWGDDPLLAVKDVGFFVRTLLPVKLTGGYTVTFGIWLTVESDVLYQAYQVWHASEYADLEISGEVANALPNWGEAVVGGRVSTEVRDPDQIPYVCGSDDPLILRILTDEWPHDEVLPYLPAQ